MRHDGPWLDTVAALAPQGKVDVVLDCVAGAYAAQNVEILRLDGRWVLYSLLTGPALPDDLAKTFHVGFWRKKVHAVRGVSFTVRRGEVFAIVGPNGAGKTTTLKMLTGLVHPDSGSASLFGAPIALYLSARWRTWITALSRSTSPQGSPRSSLARMPVKIAVTNSGRKRPEAVSRIARTSSMVGMSTP